MRILFLAIVLTVTSSGFSQSDGITADQLNREAVSLYEKREFKKAARAAASALEMARKEFGTADRRTAVMATNLGSILSGDDKRREAIIAFAEALEIYERVPSLRALELVQAFKLLGDEQYSVNDDGAETTFLRAIDSVKARFASDIQSFITANLNAGRYYALRKNYRLASERFLAGYEAAFTSFGKESKQVESVENAFACHALSKQPPKNSYKYYEDGVKKIVGSDTDQPEVVNGRAKSLPRPAYPERAREKRLGGTLVVRVLINEKGDVSAAKTVCGPPEFSRIVEEASKLARFSPTLIGNKPVTVSGFVYYHFVPR